MPTCKLCKSTGLPGARFCGGCGTPFPDEGPAVAAAGPGAAASAPSDDAAMDDLFASLGSSGAPAAGDDLADDLFGGGASGEAELDDLFSSLPDAPSEAGGDLADLFGAAPDDATAPAPAAGKADLDDFFSGDADPEISGIMEMPSPASGGDDLFGSGGGGDDLFAGPADGAEPFGIPDASDPGVASVDDLFGAGAGAMDPDALFRPTGATDKQAAVPAGDDFEDLFSDMRGDDDSSAAIDLTAENEAPTGLFDAASPDDSFDAVAAFGAAPAAGAATEALLGPADFPEPPSEVNTGGDQLEDLFGMGTSSTDDPMVESLSAEIPDLDAPPAAAGGSTAEAFEQLMHERADDSAPQVPGLEPGDLLAEAHQAVDGGPASQTGGEAPQGRDRRQRPRMRMAAGMAPEPSKVETLGEFLGFALAGLFTAGLLREVVPQAAQVPTPALGAGLVVGGGFLHFLSGLRLAPALQSRVMILVAAGLTLPHGLAATPTLPGRFLPLTMILVILAGVGHLLRNQLLALALRLTLAILGVYACLSLVGAAAADTPYEALVTRRVLEAPGLAETLGPARLELVLKAFDPLFLAVNFFLPAVLLAAAAELLLLARRKWWALAIERLVTVALVGGVLWVNLKLYAKLKVPNLLSLAGM